MGAHSQDKWRVEVSTCVSRVQSNSRRGLPWHCLLVAKLVTLHIVLLHLILNLAAWITRQPSWMLILKKMYGWDHLSISVICLRSYLRILRSPPVWKRKSEINSNIFLVFSFWWPCMTQSKLAVISIYCSTDSLKDWVFIVFIHYSHDLDFVLLLLYVDDIIIAAIAESLVQQYLSLCFSDQLPRHWYWAWPRCCYYLSWSKAFLKLWIIRFVFPSILLLWLLRKIA